MPAKKRSTASDPVITSASQDAANDSLGNVPAPKKGATKRTAKTEAATEKTPVAKKASSRTPKIAKQSDAPAPKGASTRRAKSAKTVEVIEASETVAASEAPGSMVESILVIEDLAVAVKTPIEVRPETTESARIVTDDMIRQHAFYLSLDRRGPGDPVADWLEAERSLRLHFA